MIDIYSKETGVAGKLSNFTKRYFVFDGVPCACLEGPIQAFKYKEPEIQKEICMLSGREAKLRGQEKNEEWQSSQMLWWMGKKYPRGSKDFHELLKRLFLTAYFNEKSASDLMDSNFSFLSHNIGGKDQTKTILTEAEFCFILMWVRETIRERLPLSVEEMNEVAELIEFSGLP